MEISPTRISPSTPTPPPAVTSPAAPPSGLTPREASQRHRGPRREGDEDGIEIGTGGVTWSLCSSWHNCWRGGSWSGSPHRLQGGKRAFGLQMRRRIPLGSDLQIWENNELGSTLRLRSANNNEKERVRGNSGSSSCTKSTDSPASSKQANAKPARSERETV